MKIVTQLELTNWRNFINNHPQANIFHTPEMFEVFSRTKGYRPLLWAAVGDSGEVYALLLPVEIMLYDRLPKSMARMIVYGGVLCDSSPKGSEGLSILLDAYKKATRGKNLYTELRNISDTANHQPILTKHDFIYEDHLNYLINLDRSPEELLNSIGKRTRKHISRGLRKDDLCVEVVDDREGIDLCYELIHTTYQNASVPIADRSLFEAAYDVLFDQGMVQFLLAKVKGKPAAASVELVFKGVIYGWYSGMNREYTSYTPNEMLMWHILQWGAENGCHLYDFGGAGKPDEDYGVRDFKAKFGGDLVNFGRNKYIAFPLFYKFTEFSYKVARRVLFS